jgi:hypothetical protein
VIVPTRGSPIDGGLLEEAIAKAKRAGIQVRSVYADLGFGTSSADAVLASQQIRDTVIRARNARHRSSAPVAGNAATASATDSRAESRN